jgi:pyruvate ferredoxin oxidoreductase alpha subunit
VLFRSEVKAEYLRVESEHSALAACLGSAMTGTRSFTATSSHGLAYMHEMLTYAAGGRFPLVLAIANRSIGPPWSIWGEQQDSIQQRDTGCIQLYVETAQEALDTTIQAFKIAEDPRVLTPVMVCLDGFHLSHAEESVEIPDVGDVERFLPPFRTSATLDPDNPMTLAVGASGEQYTLWRSEQQTAIREAGSIIGDVDEEFGQVFGRKYGGLVDAYRCDDADLTIAIMGSFAGVVRDAVDALRQKAVKAGMLRVRAFRPFPNQVVRQHLANARYLVVIDRDLSYGNEGALCSEIRGALYGQGNVPPIVNFIAGLGGADLLADEIESVAQEAIQMTRPEERKTIFQFLENK